MLLNLMETGIVSETKHNKTRAAHMKMSVFATSNNVSDIFPPLRYEGEDLSLNELRTMAIRSILFARKRISIFWYKHH